MKNEKTNNVLHALHKSRIGDLTKEALVKAFNDDRIYDLEGIAEHILKRIKKDVDMEKTEPRLIDYEPLSKRTSEDVARRIVHVVPEVPFVLSGITYDPKDISRFDGHALIFIPMVGADRRYWLQLFHEEIGAAVAGYFQLRQITSLVYPMDIDIPGVNTPSQPGQPPPPKWPQLNPPGSSGGSGSGVTGGGGSSSGGGGGSVGGSIGENVGSSAPFTWDQIQMFDGSYVNSNWFWLRRGYMYNDLTGVSRGGFFGGDWNDEIFSLASTNTSCIYCEHVNLQGSKLFLGPQKPIDNLVPLGWHRRISSVWNFDS